MVEVVETPLTAPVLVEVVLRGRPPLVVGTTGSSVSGVGVALGLGVGVEVGVAVVMGEAEGAEVRSVMNLVVALKVKNPTTPKAIMVRRPAINDFICPILYTRLSNLQVYEVIQPDVFVVSATGPPGRPPLHETKTIRFP